MQLCIWPGMRILCLGAGRRIHQCHQAQPDHLAAAYALNGMVKTSLPPLRVRFVWHIGNLFQAHGVLGIFSDAMLWLPLLVAGAEKVIRESGQHCLLPLVL
ncbi:hypothetical protein PO124_28850 [Bacillus licheniformis]|nr:hypothetical protein [Bacillus licheniformis]